MDQIRDQTCRAFAEARVTPCSPRRRSPLLRSHWRRWPRPGLPITDVSILPAGSRNRHRAISPVDIPSPTMPPAHAPSRSTIASARARPRNASVMTYPSRPVTRSLRADFNAEFNHIESLLIGKLRDSSGASSPPAPSAEVASVPMPRSRPVEANLQQAARNDPPPPAPSDSRTAFQKLADLVPMRFTLASLTPGDGLFAEKPDLGALGYDSQTAVYDISARAVYLPNSGEARGAFRPRQPDGRSLSCEPAHGRRDAAGRLRPEAAGKTVSWRRGAAHDAGRRKRRARPVGPAGAQLHARPQRRFQRLHLDQGLRPVPEGLSTTARSRALSWCRASAKA